MAKAKKLPHMIHFPSTIHVIREQPTNSDPYLLVVDDLSEVGDGEKVAVYERVIVKQLRVARTLD